MRIEYLGGLLVLAFVGLYFLLNYMAEKQEAEIAQYNLQEYCGMVRIYQISNGQYGWPDYNKNYDEVCESHE